MKFHIPISLFMLCMALQPALAQELAGSTASPGVEIQEHDIFVPYSASWRTLRVYTPPSYRQTKDRYPVIYALDGQNLFDDRSSFAGEWGMDETLDSLARVGYPEAIVVGIDHHGAFRIQEYQLFQHEKFGYPMGSAFLDFLVNDLKAHIDSSYRTLPDRENTAIIGSSLGGLMAFAAITRHPGVFSKAGVYSPSFWISEDYFKLDDLPDSAFKDTRIFYYAGQAEGAEMMGPFDRMKDSLRGRMEPSALNIVVDPTGEHNERSWRRQFASTYSWWFRRNE